MTRFESNEIEGTDIDSQNTKQKPELWSVKLTRAVRDPIIVYATTNTLPFGTNHEIYDNITEARIEQLYQTQANERIESATIPEVLVYLYTASFDERNMNQEFNQLYGHAIKQYRNRWSTSLPESVNVDLFSDENLEGNLMAKFQSLRENIKSDRDRYFIANMYDEINVQTVPKTFWVHRSGDGSALDASAQKAIKDLSD